MMGEVLTQLNQIPSCSAFVQVRLKAAGQTWSIYPPSPVL